jgi:hypothetical protein
MASAAPVTPALTCTYVRVGRRARTGVHKQPMPREGKGCPECGGHFWGLAGGSDCSAGVLFWCCAGVSFFVLFGLRVFAACGGAY